MAKSPKKPALPDFPDDNAEDRSAVRTVRQLVAVMRANELSELMLDTGSLRVRLRRGGVAPAAAFAPLAAAVPVAAPVASAAPAVPAAPKDDGALVIKSPTVGTYYGSPNPESPAFVKVGQAVKPDTVVCIIEAMKVFNDIPAGVAGTITEVLLENKAAVEYGQPLFKYKPA